MKRHIEEPRVYVALASKAPAQLEEVCIWCWWLEKIRLAKPCEGSEGRGSQTFIFDLKVVRWESPILVWPGLQHNESWPRETT